MDNKIIGLAFNNETYQIYDDVSQIDNMNTLDGCFRIFKDNHLITDSNGFLPTFYDHKNKSIVSHTIYEYKDNPYSPIFDNIDMDLNENIQKFYSYPKDIPNIFEYFETWFFEMYKSIISKYPKTALGITMGLDSRYLLAILMSRDVTPICYTWGEEGKKTKKLFSNLDVNLIDIKKYRFKKIKEYSSYYNDYNYKDWSSEYPVYLYYSLIQSEVDVLIEGLGRNFYCTSPRIETSSDIQTIRTSFSCGRAPHILQENIKTFFPFSCRNIRYNLRRLNLSETSMVELIHSRIRYLYPSIADLSTLSYDKAKVADKNILNEFSKNYMLPKL